MLDYTPVPKSPKKGTSLLNQNYKTDSDVRLFIDGTHEPHIPSKLRTLHFYMPQEVNPIMRMNVKKLIVGREKGQEHLDLSLQYAKMLGVSRNHAEIYFENGYYFVTDLGSTNGTYINEHKLIPHKAYLLQQSDEIRFGHFLVVIAYS
ncbi:MAG: hypothetical protein Phog2KO_14440 [Phototrophicaceae bacterium]